MILAGSWKLILIIVATVAFTIGIFLAILYCFIQRKKKIRKEAERLLNEKSSLVFPKYGIGQIQQTFEEIRHSMIESTSANSPQCLGTRNSFAGHNLPKKIITYGSVSDALSINLTDNYKARKMSTDSGIAGSIGIGNVIPDLYQRRGTIVRRESSPSVSVCGTVHFKLLYIFKTSDLMVKIEKVNNIPSTTISKLVSNRRDFNSYITIEISPPVDQKIRQTSLKKNESSPTFAETFKFPIAYEELYTHSLTFSIYELNQMDYSKQKFGKANIALNTVDPSMEVEIWLDIIIIEPEKRGTRGQLLVSLNYLPSAGRLTLVVMKAKNIIVTNVDEDNYNYLVRVNQYEKEKIIKKRKTGYQKADNLNWNEVMIFKFDKDKFDDIYLEVRLVQKDINGIETSVGDFVLGKNSPSLCCIEHFCDIIYETKEPYTMWHDLQKDL